MQTCKGNSLVCDCEKCFNRTFASHRRSLDLVDKNIDASKILLSSRVKYLFQCDRCPHQFESSISNIVSLGRWCAYCCVPLQRLCNCNICFNKSFASHPKSVYLVDKTIDASKITLGSNKTYEFQCDVCNHKFMMSINHITRKDKPSWCGYCSTPTKHLCIDMNCEFCLKNSFASHPKSVYLVDKSLNPRNIFLASATHYLFQCDKCPHQFEKAVYSITSKNNPVWCPFCSNQTLCDCNICYDKSFANHYRCLYLVDKTLDPTKLFMGSSKKYLFKCDMCNGEFMSALCHVTSKNDPKWCRFCKNKSEKALYDYALQKYPDTIHQFTPLKI